MPQLFHSRLGSTEVGFLEFRGSQKFFRICIYFNGIPQNSVYKFCGISCNTVKNLRTQCCTQVTKTKDSYMYQKSSSAETRWRAVDWVTAREHNVLATEYGWNHLFSGCTVTQSSAHHLVTLQISFLLKLPVLGFIYLFANESCNTISLRSLNLCYKLNKIFVQIFSNPGQKAEILSLWGWKEGNLASLPHSYRLLNIHS